MNWEPWTDAAIIVKAANIAIIMDHMPRGMVKMK